MESSGIFNDYINFAITKSKDKRGLEHNNQFIYDNLGSYISVLQKSLKENKTKEYMNHLTKNKGINLREREHKNIKNCFIALAESYYHCTGIKPRFEDKHFYDFYLSFCVAFDKFYFSYLCSEKPDSDPCHDSKIKDILKNISFAM